MRKSLNFKQYDTNDYLFIIVSFVVASNLSHMQINSYNKGDLVECISISSFVA